MIKRISWLLNNKDIQKKFATEVRSFALETLNFNSWQKEIADIYLAVTGQVQN
ncbi:hypothetical protein ACFLV7_16170 [Chloroflexota bacterium]